VHSTPTSKADDCETPGLFFGCRDTQTTHHRHSITSAPTVTSAAPTSASASKVPTDKKCKHSAFFGLICLDLEDEPREQKVLTATRQVDEKQWNSEL